jgi:hypothetical protein
MKLIQFFRPVLQALDKGHVIRTAVVLALRILGVLTVLAGIYLLVEILRISFRFEQTQGTIGGLVFAIIFVAAVAALFQTFFYRAESIRDLGESPFTVIPIFSILLRLLGEVYATLGVAVGVGGCLLIWFSGISPFRLMPGIGDLFPAVGGGGTFLDGLMFLVWLAVLSLVAVVGFYFLAESVVVVVDIARNIRLLVKQSTASSETTRKGLAG